MAKQYGLRAFRVKEGKIIKAVDKIFDKHGVRSPKGALEKVRKKSKKDAKRLLKLVTKWNKLYIGRSYQIGTVRYM